MIHLTFTGISAGVLLCGETRENKEVNHAVYAPLNNSEFRKKCCPKCLNVWAKYAYDEDEEFPEWIKEERKRDIK